MASNDRRSMGLRRLAKMLFTYRMPGFLSESRQPESTRLVPMWPGMRLRLIDSFPGQPCAMRERGWLARASARTPTRPPFVDLCRSGQDLCGEFPIHEVVEKRLDEVGA